MPQNVPGFLVDWLRRNPWLRFIPLILALIVLILLLILSPGATVIGIGVAVIGALLYLYRYLTNLLRRIEGAESIAEENQTPESVDRLPKSPDFRLADLNSGFTPASGATDSVVAIRFKGALKDAYRLVEASAAVGIKPERPAINLPRLADATFTSIDPNRTVPARTWGSIRLPGRIIDLVGEEFKEAMAYPEFDTPMYRPLVTISSELFLPNINFIEPNSISLLETNQKFIESYLVGLNHEFARELLWREYPTDQRGSYFRQFWDVRGFVTPVTSALGAEAMKDIKPIHTWKKTEKLGYHNARDPEGDPEQLVFVVRGELLKKFPNTVIYAQKAILASDGVTKVIRQDTENEKEIIFPIYQAEIQPDIKLLGFNLTIEQAAGTEETDDFPGDTLGWFFIIAEVPGEARFGMDLTYNPNNPEIGPFTWNDLSWENFGGQNLEFVRGSITPGNTGKPGGEFPPPNSNAAGTWNRSSADMAAILFQRPVMIATHATEMLDEEVIDDAKK